MFLSALFQRKMFKLIATSGMLVALLLANFGMVSAAGVAPGAVYV